ncbi:MAG: hypothetical protein M1812_004803 [Candelaria pacifica]|nr:MAG: hypothetical protein M1812_004803 [Candelaria pacifica]
MEPPRSNFGSDMHASGSQSTNGSPLMMLAEQQELRPDRTGKRFTGHVFELLVGPEKVPMSAHKSVLCQSPVFSRMCLHETPSKGEEMRHIFLEDDDPNTFALILEYLYTTNYHPLYAHPSSCEEVDVDLPGQVSMYIMAGKYELDNLMDLITKKIRHLTPVRDTTFWTTAKSL